jgi:Ca2+-binding EF-hand superfamily protein|eukprot:COSAG01_NODE_4696_length_4806_cov_4.618016_2_plen_178_part_00
MPRLVLLASQSEGTAVGRCYSNTCLFCSGFRKRFHFSVVQWDWKENALQTLADQVMAGYPSVDAAFRGFMDRAATLSLRPMNWVNFPRMFADIDEVLQLRLRPFEWKQLFHICDTDDDGIINCTDFRKTFDNFEHCGRVTPVHGARTVNLSSAEVFRRADTACDGFLDYEDFKVLTN